MTMPMLEAYADVVAVLTRAQRRRVTMPALMLLIHALHLEDEAEKFATVSGSARFLGMTPSAVTSIASNLEARGWIERVRDRTDKRVVYLSLTDAARSLISEIFHS